MSDSAIVPLEEALTDIEGKIATTEASIAANEEQLSVLTAENDSLEADLAKYETIRNDLIDAIDNLTVEEEDPEHPITPDDPIEDAEVDDDDYEEDDEEDFEYA